MQRVATSFSNADEQDDAHKLHRASKQSCGNLGNQLISRLGGPLSEECPLTAHKGIKCNVRNLQKLHNEVSNPPSPPKHQKKLCKKCHAKGNALLQPRS